jgi:predicted AAA+ superfamily ATPase
MWIDRRLAARVLDAARQFPALVVTGGRQTGKTTLLRHLFPAASFASLDLPSAASQADE